MHPGSLARMPGRRAPIRISLLEIARRIDPACACFRAPCRSRPMSDCDPDLKRSEAAKGNFPADSTKARPAGDGGPRLLSRMRQPILTLLLLGTFGWAHAGVDAQTEKPDRQAASIT